MALKPRQHWLCAAQPRSFAGLMALYESNYRRFVRLAPETDLPFAAAVSRAPQDRDLHLRVLERCKYTTTVHLTYWFEINGGRQAAPDLRIRLYRDAGLAEAVHCQTPGLCTGWPQLGVDRQPDLRCQWTRNLVVNKWLAFCLQHGHGFATAHRPRRAIA